tara:strand:- start:2412 stop:2948 length:537 start_codon:yes stop_codon:yes gene_type:complete
MKKLLIILIIIFAQLFINIDTSYASEITPIIGEDAPSFSLEGINKNIPDKTIFSNKDFKNKWLIIYFYPKDFTTGCSIEAKGFTSLKNEFDILNAEIIGISADSKDSHNKFCTSNEINYTLLSDPNGLVSESYGSWIPPYSDRNTFLISPEGKITYKWITVVPLNHAKQVFNKLKQII